MPSRWKLGGMRMSLTTTCGQALGPSTRLVVVVGDADDLEVGLARQHRRHALADEDAVVGEEDGDLTPMRPSARHHAARRAQRGDAPMLGGASHTAGGAGLSPHSDRERRMAASTGADVGGIMSIERIDDLHLVDPLRR